MQPVKIFYHSPQKRYFKNFFFLFCNPFFAGEKGEQALVRTQFEGTCAIKKKSICYKIVHFILFRSSPGSIFAAGGGHGLASRLACRCGIRLESGSEKRPVQGSSAFFSTGFVLQTGHPGRCLVLQNRHPGRPQDCLPPPAQSDIPSAKNILSSPHHLHPCVRWRMCAHSPRHGNETLLLSKCPSPGQHARKLMLHHVFFGTWKFPGQPRTVRLRQVQQEKPIPAVCGRKCCPKARPASLGLGRRSQKAEQRSLTLTSTCTKPGAACPPLASRNDTGRNKHIW